jgi:hypothetical protein
MKAGRVAVLDHHYGLWYDRRRDDHLMVRRATGDVAPPFYEQPFARTGTGTAWDGLSKYDLTKPNPWYWNRLRTFAELCERDGLVLVHQNYFQHNILEAGGHWADCPWRPANNVNDTGLPEPPPYVGDKRLFFAHQFYDVTNESLRALHRGYIRQCLDNFADSSNVIQMTSAEYTGPLAFTQFWIDTIAEWEAEHGRDVLVGLSATKDVQDAILADAARSRHVDVIDIRYWHYEADGDAYAPPGGANMAPRQHARQMRPRRASFASVVRAVREYRSRFPDKAVIYSSDAGRRGSGWAVLIGGGSLPATPRLPDAMAGAIPSMRPRDGIVDDDSGWCLANEDGDALLYFAETNDDVAIQLPSPDSNYVAHWIDPSSGEIMTEESIAHSTSIKLTPKSNILWLEREE